MNVRFLHTSDWQLGMTRRFLDAEGQVRYTDDQFATIRRIAEVATETSAKFVIVAGDIFDSFVPDRRIIARALEALGAFTVPVYLVPGNHDADTPAALWANSDVIEQLPTGVFLLRETKPVSVASTTVEVVGVPLPTRKPDRDLVNEVLAGLEPVPQGTTRVVVAHGQVGGVAWSGPDESAVISLGSLETAVADGRASYIALGDRHSVTRVGSTGAIWYSGASLATDFREDDPNKVLIVDLTDGGVTVEPVQVGRWRFVVREFELTGSGDLGEIEDFLATIDDKERTVVKLGLKGTVSLSINTELEALLDRARDLLGGLEVSSRRTELVVLTDNADLAELDLSGFARTALDELATEAAAQGEDAVTARDALMLLHRLVGRTK